jgi:two-component system NtrC family sensor kinase
VRCQKIVQSLLSFARRHQPERKLVCVNALVEAAVGNPALPNADQQYRSHHATRSALPQAMVDPHQLQQVFLNLINNARQAIEAHLPSGWVRVTSDTCGTNIRVTFQDNGPGIPRQISPRSSIRSSPRRTGQGHRSGLSLCYGIVNDMAAPSRCAANRAKGRYSSSNCPLPPEERKLGCILEAPYSVLANPLEGTGKKSTCD